MDVDYLSLSFVSELWQAEFERQSADMPVAYFCGYRGFWIREGHGSLFWGMKERRQLVVASSAKAAEVAQRLAASDGDMEDEKCNRLDWQKSVTVQGCDETIASLVDALRQNPRRRLTYVQSLPEGGATLYVGSPASARRLRIYNKTAQMGVKLDAEVMRIELVLRDKAAKQSWSIARRHSIQRAAQVSVALAVDMVPELALYLGLPQVDVPRMDEEPSYRVWIETIVKPALIRIGLSEPDLLGELLAFIRELAGEE